MSFYCYSSKSGVVGFLYLYFWNKRLRIKPHIYFCDLLIHILACSLILRVFQCTNYRKDLGIAFAPYLQFKKGELKKWWIIRILFKFLFLNVANLISSVESVKRLGAWIIVVEHLASDAVHLYIGIPLTELKC